ncbi:MAG: type II toxin-antitoxin system RelE/ParE family toxin [Bacteroidetes bacterium]|nr:type II toxin-antitoxin system RelE/ParE family toxin [Bacteroidota bacterium]
MIIVYLNHFYKDISVILSKKILAEIANVIDIVEKADKPQDIPNLKKLKGFKSAYRIKIGNYRIGVVIQKDKIIFARIAHRKDIYKLFP